MEIKQVNRLKEKYDYRTKLKLSSKLIGRIKAANFMEISETALSLFIKKTESNLLFKKLMYPDKKCERVICYKKLYHGDLSKYFLELKEDLIPERSSFEVHSLLSEYKELVPIIKKIGLNKFKQYFLYNESNIPGKEIADLCNLEINVVKSINELVDQLSTYSEFFHPSASSPEEGINYTKIASIQKDDSGNLTIGYFSPHFARGRYFINYNKLKLLKDKGLFSEIEVYQIEKLIKNLEIINSRKLIIHEVIQNLVERQSAFLKTGKTNKLVILLQKEIAAKLNVNPSSVCRAINGRTIITPQEIEMPLKAFFPSRKDIRKNLIEEIVSEENRHYKNIEIRDLLLKRYGIKVSLHLVCICRNS